MVSRRTVVILGRAAWVAVTLTALALLVLSFPAVGKQVQNDPAFITFRNYALPETISRYAMAQYFTALRYAALLVFFAMGALIFWRKSDRAMGLLTAFVLVLLPASVLRYGGQPEFWRLPTLWDDNLPIIDSALTGFGIVGFVAFLYLFPDGRFVPGRLWAAPVALSALLLAISSFSSTGDLSWQVMVGAGYAILLIAVAGQIYRYRQADPETRRQLRWVLGGLIAFPLSLLVAALLSLPEFPLKVEGVVSLVLLHVNLLVPVVLPIALAVATLRYRLWDMGLVVRRSLTYVIVTGLLALVFVITVVALQRVFTGATGQESPVALVASTLVIAALFSPLRARVQRFIDRRFYRRKYDAQRVLAEFGRVTRDETDIDRVAGGLVRAVLDTVEPAQLSVWVRKQ